MSVPLYLNLIVLVEALSSIHCLKNAKEKERKFVLKQMLWLNVKSPQQYKHLKGHKMCNNSWHAYFPPAGLFHESLSAVEKKNDVCHPCVQTLSSLNINSRRGNLYTFFANENKSANDVGHASAVWADGDKSREPCPAGSNNTLNSCA
jgi:hypothetical protein